MVWSWLTWFGAGIYLLTETPGGDRREGSGVLQGVTLSLRREIDNTALYTRHLFGELLCIVLASQILFAKSQYLGTIEGGYVCVSDCLPLLLFVLLLDYGPGRVLHDAQKQNRGRVGHCRWWWWAATCELQRYLVRLEYVIHLSLSKTWIGP